MTEDATHKNDLELAADILIACIENGMIYAPASAEEIGDYFQTLYHKISDARPVTVRSG